MTSSSKILLACLALLLVLTTNEKILASESVDLPEGFKLELGKACAVCGMKVGGELESPAIYGYSENRLISFAGAAAAVFQDGNVIGFDGARCLFIYNTIPKRFGIDVTKIKHRWVVDFDSKQFIDVNRAFFVLGTPIRGFMGYDLIPFTSQDRAEAFKAEFKGKKIIQLQKATPAEVDR